MSHTWRWAKKQPGTNYFCFMTGRWCERAGLGQTTSFKVLLILAVSPCVYLLLSSNLWEFTGLMLLSQSNFYLTSSKVRKYLFFVVCKQRKEGKKGILTTVCIWTLFFPMQHQCLTLVFIKMPACILQSKISVFCRSYIAHAAWLSFFAPPPSNTPTMLCGTTSECGKVGCLWILNFIFPMSLQKYC